MFLSAASVLAVGRAEAKEGFRFSDWWLPPNYSEHGGEMDALFMWIFVITMVSLILVSAVMVYFLIRYRHRPGGPRGYYIHGNARLEMVWTIIPAIILALLAVASTKIWTRYRNPNVSPGETAQIMVIGEQFKWNVIYPGPDGVVGEYLKFPRPSDPKYRALPGPDAMKRIESDIQEQPLGKQDDAAGKDDDWEKSPGRPVFVPVDKHIEILLASKDVLHDFALPNFRVKLDAVPGLRGKIHFKAKPEAQSTHETPVDRVNLDDRIWVDRDTQGAKAADEATYVIADPKNPAASVGRMDTLRFLVIPRLTAAGVATPTPEQIQAELGKVRADLKAAGIDTLTTIRAWEVVCEELCGMGHSTMKAELIVLSQKQYSNFIHKNAAPVAGGSGTSLAGK
jgi:heme/copper-type cytochrome/quinol oxidase subunit 2